MQYLTNGLHGKLSLGFVKWKAMILRNYIIHDTVIKLNNDDDDDFDQIQV